MYSIKLDKEISCDYICNAAQKLINEYHKINGSISECILVMTIKQPVDHDGDNPILKLELQQ